MSGRRIENRQATEGRTLKASVTSEEPIGLLERVGSNQEIGDQPLAWAASLAVRTPGRSGP